MKSILRLFSRNHVEMPRGSVELDVGNSYVLRLASSPLGSSVAVFRDGHALAIRTWAPATVDNLAEAIDYAERIAGIRRPRPARTTGDER